MDFRQQVRENQLRDKINIIKQMYPNLDMVKVKEDKIQKSVFDEFEPDETDIEKGGAGSRGGTVIGHTKSGKPIYAERNARHEKTYDHKDHEDAAYAHLDHVQKQDAKYKEQHGQRHNDEFDRHINTSKYKKTTAEFSKSNVLVDIEKSLNKIGLLLGEKAVNDIEKSINHKYTKRTGSPGHYEYEYGEESGNKRNMKITHKVGDKVVDSEGNKFTITNIKESKDDFIDHAVQLRGEAGSGKEIGYMDLKHFKKSDEPKKEEERKAYGQVNSFDEATKEGFNIDYVLFDDNNKIVGGFKEMNIPNYTEIGTALKPTPNKYVSYWQLPNKGEYLKDKNNWSK